jgi:hypothetical protein
MEARRFFVRTSAMILRILDGMLVRMSLAVVWSGKILGRLDRPERFEKSERLRGNC